jgi:hypothetical protein
MALQFKPTDSAHGISGSIQRFEKRVREPNEALPMDINLMAMPRLKPDDLPKMVATRPGSDRAFTIPSKGACRGDL